MSFGFSLSDFFGCAQLAWRVYEALKYGPGECGAFGRECLLFHNILFALTESLRECNDFLSPSERTVLLEHAEASYELLASKIFGAISIKVRRKLDESEENSAAEVNGVITVHSYYDRGFFKSCIGGDFAHNVRRRFCAAAFARHIPKLQHAVTAQVEKLTALNVILIRSSQNQILSSQRRTELLQCSLNSQQLQFDNGQTRIEAQLQRILEGQERQQTMLFGKSLDSSSPEGRQTWMNLGRLLRKEGIGPNDIEKNKYLLIKAMKGALKTEARLATSSTSPASYRTAPEYARDFPSSSIARDVGNISRERAFSHSKSPKILPLQDRINKLDNIDTATLLNEQHNIDTGFESLLAGMNVEALVAEHNNANCNNDTGPITEAYILESENKSKIRNAAAPTIMTKSDLTFQKQKISETAAWKQWQWFAQM